MHSNCRTFAPPCTETNLWTAIGLHKLRVSRQKRQENGVNAPGSIRWLFRKNNSSQCTGIFFCGRAASLTSGLAVGQHFIPCTLHPLCYANAG